MVVLERGEVREERPVVEVVLVVSFDFLPNMVLSLLSSEVAV